MNLRQKSSRYGAAVLFCAGAAAGVLLFLSVRSQFILDLEFWLGLGLVATLILHARAGFALSRKQQEIDLLKSVVDRFEERSPDHSASTDKDLPTIDFGAMTASDAADAAILGEVRSAIENDRVDLYLQPIVSLPQRKQRFFEAFSRLRREDNSVLRPSTYIEAAERANRIGLIDNMILLRAVQALRDLGPESQHYRVFCNISPATIFDTDFFSRFADFLDANDDLAPRLVFEFTYPAVELMHPRVQDNLNDIADRGFAFSVDHIRRLDLNWQALRARNFRYVKASSAMLLAQSRGDDNARMRVKAFKDRLREADIDLIVEKVEMEAHVPEILALGLDFGQGELFGAPRPAQFYLESPEVQEFAEAS